MNIPRLINTETNKEVELGDEIEAIDGLNYILKGILLQNNRWVVWLKGLNGSIPDQSPSYIHCYIDFL
jgi:hypothetical protein